MEDEGIEVEGVEIMFVCMSERKSLMSRDRSNSEKGRAGCRCLDEAGLGDRLDLGAVLESRDSKRVMSLDTAILRAGFNVEGRMVVDDLLARERLGRKLYLARCRCEADPQRTEICQLRFDAESVAEKIRRQPAVR